MRHDWNDRYEHGLRAGRWLVGAPLMLIVWGLLIWGVVALVRNRGSLFGSEKASDGSARRILDERFARGEIDADEYKSRVETLTSTR